MFSAESTSHRGAADKFVMGGNTFEIAPANGCLILCEWDDSGYFECEIVFATPLKSALLHIGGISRVLSIEPAMPQQTKTHNATGTNSIVTKTFAEFAGVNYQLL